MIVKNPMIVSLLLWELWKVTQRNDYMFLVIMHSNTSLEYVYLPMYHILHNINTIWSKWLVMLFNLVAVRHRKQENCCFLWTNVFFLESNLSIDSSHKRRNVNRYDVFKHVVVVVCHFKYHRNISILLILCNKMKYNS